MEATLTIQGIVFMFPLNLLTIIYLLPAQILKYFKLFKTDIFCNRKRQMKPYKIKKEQETNPLYYCMWQ